MALRDDLLPVFNDARKLIGDLGLRTSGLTIRVRSWTGGLNGPEVRMGTYTDSDLVITPRPKIEEVEGVMTASRITPKHATGGYTTAELNPAPTLTAGQEVLYIVTGPNGTHVYVAADVQWRKNFGYEIKLLELDRAVPN